MSTTDEINEGLEQAFVITCRKCNGTLVEYRNNIRYYDYTGKVGSAELACQNCDNEVVFDD